MPTTRRKALEASDPKDTAEQKELRESGLYHLGGHRLKFNPGDPQGLVKIFRHGREVASAVNVGTEDAIEFYVPQIYPEPTVPAYLICGTLVEARSLTRNEQDAFIDYEAERELEDKTTQLSKLQLEWTKSFKTDRNADMLAGLKKSLETARDNLYAKIASDPAKVKTVRPQLQGIADQLRDLDAEQEQLEKDPSDVITQLNTVSPEQRALSRELDDIGLGSVHLLAKMRGDTTEEFEEWQKRATLEDYKNAWTVRKLGNAASNSIEDAPPLTSEQRRRIELNKILKYN